jgi:hypothetical protein
MCVGRVAGANDLRASHVRLTTIRRNRVVTRRVHLREISDRLVKHPLLTLGLRQLIGVVAALAFYGGDKIFREKHRQERQIAPPHHGVAQQIDAKVAAREVLTLKVEGER